METPETLPLLDAEEIRVLGCLIEKSKVTPEYYPMTINGLTAACNQKTSRKPVVNYDEQNVALILDRLKRKGLVSTATGAGSRTVKYKHNLALMFPFTPDELAILCLLFLRGPQTPGELNTNSGRLYEFDDLEEVQNVLEKLSSAETPFVLQLARRAGQKEMRYRHLFSGEQALEEDFEEVDTAAKSNNDVELRLSAVELELAELKAAFQALMKELNG